MSENAAATPRALRTIISIVGRRNAGKSSLINALCGQEVAIVSSQAGTTTDAVAKPYELLPLGPVTFFDTAGLDDEGELGAQRIKATKKVLCRSDVAVAVVGEDGLQAKDKEIIEDILALKIPLAVAFNKKYISAPAEADLAWLRAKNVPFEVVSAAACDNLDALKKLIISLVPDDQKKEPLLASDLFEAKDIVLLVVPIDLSAPRGRLILPQVQVLREILDKGAKAIAVKESELSEMLAQLKTKPALVITDSQVVMKVAPIVPLDVPLTTFSILFARFKGDLKKLVHDIMGGKMPINVTESAESYPHPIPAVHSPSPIQEAVDVEEETMSLEEVEKEMIRKALEKHNGRRKNAAADLKISERTLYRKIKEYNLE